MNWNTEKQARLDAFEIRRKWPELGRTNFWPIDKLVAARRASVALYDADVNECNDHDQEHAKNRTSRAEKRARRVMAELQAEIADAFLSQGVNIAPDFVCILVNGYGFRFLALAGRDNYYYLIG